MILFPLNTNCVQGGKENHVADDDILLSLRALAAIREQRGDKRLSLNPDSLSFELSEATVESDRSTGSGQVLEFQTNDKEPFRSQDLARRTHKAHIEAFCDGTRSTYFVGNEDNFPIIYTSNASAVRTRDRTTGYHVALPGVQRQQATLLAPFNLFNPTVLSMYERLGLYNDRHADLCWTSPDENNTLPPFPRMAQLGNAVWQYRARRRARYLLDQSEQITAIAGARVLREQDPTGRIWLLKDGSFSQFRHEYLRKVEPLRNIVSCVKTHPVAYFGAEGERILRQLDIGQRSVAFLPRPATHNQKSQKQQPVQRPMVSWYLRVRPANRYDANHMSGIVRLDIASIDDWRDWIDEISWAVLDEFHGISAMPDPRHDVMAYGIYDCEQFLKTNQLTGDLLLAQLRS